MTTPRKRSAYVGFSAMTLSAALIGCGERQPQVSAASEAPVYATLAACKAEHPGDACDKGLQEAGENHLKTAPSFADKKACETDWGQDNCVSAPNASGHSSFFPIMAGFMLGRALNGGFGPANSSSVYAGPRGAYAGGTRIGDSTMRNGRFTAPTRSMAQVRSGAVSRGGFGRSAGYRGGMGG
jgi:uncharacterized protein YgiB involved in biofilm formation